MRTTKTACRNLQPTEASAVIELQTRTKYTYDPVGNRLSNVSGSGWSNNTSNELTSRPGVTYSYDANGNTTSKSDSTGATTYAWDYENRLVSVALPGSGGTVTFKYDPFGRRIYKSSSSATSVYTYDGDNLIEETNSTGSVVARYSQGLNIDEPLVGLRSGTTSYYEADGLGSVTTLSNAAGAVSNNYTYDSFGNLVASSGSIVNNFRYTGREWDPETSLYYYRARYYDQAAGRFLAEDPARFGGGPNFYPYVTNNSVNRKDPRGLWQVTVGGGEFLGGDITFGSNGGQWNLGLYTGVGEGLFFKIDPSNSGGCHKFGAHGGLKLDLDVTPGGAVSVDATTEEGSEGEANVQVGIPGVGGVAWNPAKPHEPPHGLVFGGEGLFAGFGFSFHSAPTQCGCQD